MGLRFLALALLPLALAACALGGGAANPETAPPEAGRMPGSVASPAPSALPTRPYPCTLEVRRTADDPALPQPALIAPGEPHVYIVVCREMRRWVELYVGMADAGTMGPAQLEIIAGSATETKYRLRLTMPATMPPDTDLWITLMIDGRFSGELHVRVSAPQSTGGGR